MAGDSNDMPTAALTATDENGWEGTAAPTVIGPTYRSAADGRVVSLSVPCPGVSPAVFLAAARGGERFFWEDVRQDISYAGFGVAANLLAWGPERFDHIHAQARALFAGARLLSAAPDLAAPRLFGGFSFRDDFIPDELWASFHPAHFVLPHYQFVRVGDEPWLTLNVLVPVDELPQEGDVESLRAELEGALRERVAQLQEAETAPAQPRHPAPERVRYPMAYEAWAQKIETARAAIAGGDLKKVVLARICELHFARRVDVDAALAFLNRRYNDCYRFLFEPRPHHAFYGATPELLVSVHGDRLRTMALAGSIRRSDDGREDEALGQQLLASEKDRHEHQLVVLSILGRLGLLTHSLEMSPQPGVYKLRNIQHLLTPLSAHLKEDVGVMNVVQALHPTPALGGSPRGQALAFIREHEPEPRGWYAAPVGWLAYRPDGAPGDELDGAFAVAIRSAVSRDHTAWLYAGAGIVGASEPEKEWAETALKFRPMLNALGAPEAAAV
ncbi:MAG: isochorismate synthase [Candidatus Promineifilaceae bacterium]|nr:isochorismate synthase [Candidatus Promineifilaceae bacterium]